MQAINESLEHGKKAEAYADQARQKDDFPDSEMAWIESNLAVAKAITGLALAVLAHDGKVAAQQVVEADRAGSPDVGAAKAANRIVLFGGVGDYDGAYEWVKESEYGRVENTVGFHEGYPDSYTVVEVL